ncbi:MAG: shikimate kinase [Thermoplasmata archaeon]|nr:shikimate kinase [Thermoplasmata archaeon]
MRKGIASSRGAISILNAIPTGTGAAMGITLQTDAEVIVEEGESKIDVFLEEREENNLLARECIRGLFAQCKETIGKITVKTKSTIPVSRGLKSSSAAANAITLAAARAIDANINDIDMIKLGVEAAKRAKVTVTGAFDDATACYFGGIAVTDNSEMKILNRSESPSHEIRVIIHVPKWRIRKRGISQRTFSLLRKEFEKAERLVRKGDFFTALTLNGELVARSLDIDNSVAEAALRKGAIAAGISGTGPATAILTKGKSFNDVLDAVSCDDSAVIVASLNNTPAPEVKPRL